MKGIQAALRLSHPVDGTAFLQAAPSLLDAGDWAVSNQGSSELRRTSCLSMRTDLQVGQIARARDANVASRLRSAKHGLMRLLRLSAGQQVAGRVPAHARQLCRGLRLRRNRRSSWLGAMQAGGGSWLR